MSCSLVRRPSFVRSCCVVCRRCVVADAVGVRRLRVENQYQEQEADWRIGRSERGEEKESVAAASAVFHHQSFKFVFDSKGICWKDWRSVWIWGLDMGKLRVGVGWNLGGLEHVLVWIRRVVSCLVRVSSVVASVCKESRRRRSVRTCCQENRAKNKKKQERKISNNKHGEKSRRRKKEVRFGQSPRRS